MDVTDLVQALDTKQKVESLEEPQTRGSRMGSRVKAFLREPLFQFLMLGGLLFGYFEWRGGASPGSNKIVITRGQIEHLAAGFARGWQRPPTDIELKGLIDEYVKEEIANREAVAIGLDRDDTIIRRRLRQKLEFLAEDAVPSAAPTDAELQAWLRRHPESFRAEPKVAFRQVYLNADRHGAALCNDAAKLLARLQAAGPNAGHGVGDSSMLPSEQRLAPLMETARVFGEDFAAQLPKLATGKWSGPVESSFGLHLVLLREKATPPQLQLAEIGPHVEREFLAERRRAELQALYDRLLQKYWVKVDRLEAAK